MTDFNNQAHSAKYTSGFIVPFNGRFCLCLVLVLHSFSLFWYIDIYESHSFFGIEMLVYLFILVGNTVVLI